MIAQEKFTSLDQVIIQLRENDCSRETKGFREEINLNCQEQERRRAKHPSPGARPNFIQARNS
jgi:hypothetical protein